MAYFLYKLINLKKIKNTKQIKFFYNFIAKFPIYNLFFNK